LDLVRDMHWKNESRVAFFDTTDLDYFWHEMRTRDIKKKCTEISQIFNNITEMYQRCNHKHKYTITHDFYQSKKYT
jgi:hypothetical protein